MTLKNLLLPLFLVSSCAINTNLSPEAEKLKTFNNPYSKLFCKKTKEVVMKEKTTGLFGDGDAKERVLNLVAKSGANYYDKDEFDVKIRGLELTAKASGYLCNFKSVKLTDDATDVEVYTSDHISVNCNRKSFIETNYYNDDHTQILNKVKNLVHEKGGNVGNIEKTKKSLLKVGVYNCSTKQMAKARIEIRKEQRDEMKLKLARRRNYLQMDRNQAIRSAYSNIALQLSIMNMH